MNETRAMLVDAASRLFAAQATRDVREAAEDGAWPHALWSAIEAAGLPEAARCDSRGGVGASLADVAALVRTAGAFAIPVPLAETFLAEWLLAAADLAPEAGALAVGPVLRTDQVTLTRSGDTWIASGTLHRVPWARHASSLVIVARCTEGWVTAIVRNPVNVLPGSSYAAEPRDTVRLDGHVLEDADVSMPGRGWAPDDLHSRGALLRCVAMSGALQKILELSVQYAKERVQFGKPIGKFQAVQQQIAVLASEVAASHCAAQSAVDAAALGPGRGYFETAAAKARIGEAAGIVSAIAHQVHGAMGFTHEHELHRSTRRLWAWRDEFGTEGEWSEWVGRMVAQVGGDKLWAYLTAIDKEAVTRRR